MIASNSDKIAVKLGLKQFRWADDKSQKGISGLIRAITTRLLMVV